jgi:OPT family oligopeptide transporter
LKLAHYIKIPPRQTFAAQVVATLVSTLVCVGILNFQMNDIPGVCTVNAPNHFTCPGINTFFTAAVLWGTIGPKKVFGAGGQYTALQVGWALGVIVVVFFWWIQRRFPNSRWLRQVHPVVMISGALIWAPYNLSYFIPAVPVGWVSWIWIKNRHLDFWGKYNYVLSASFSTAIAVAGIIMFFSVQWTDQKLYWWGNNVTWQDGCESTPCTLHQLGDGEIFGPKPGEFAF